MEKERTSPWLILFRVVFTAALIACIAFIFRNSMESGTVSSARSQAVMVYINNLLAKVCAGGLPADALHPRVHKAFCAPHELAAAGRYDNGADG